MKEIDIINGYKAEEIDLIVNILCAGGVVVLPTDTVYGLHCRADNKKAIAKIIRIKQRPAGFGFVHLMSSYCMVHDHAYVSRRQDKYLRTVWPASTRELQNFAIKSKQRPTTMILRSRLDLPALGRGGLDSVAIRLPKNELLIKIIKEIKVPLISSSLNICSQADIAIKDIGKTFKVKPDLVVNGGKLAKKSPSRLLDIRNIDKIKLIRK